MADLLRVLLYDSVPEALASNLTQTELDDFAVNVTRRVLFFSPSVGLDCWDRNRVRATGLPDGPRKNHLLSSSSPFPQFCRRGTACALGLRKGYDGNRIAHDLFSRARTGNQSNRNADYAAFKLENTIEHLISESDDVALACLHHSSFFWCMAVPRKLQPLSDGSVFLRWLLRHRVKWTLRQHLAAQNRAENVDTVLYGLPADPAIPDGSWVAAVIREAGGHFWQGFQKFPLQWRAPLLNDQLYGTNSLAAWIGGQEN